MNATIIPCEELDRRRAEKLLMDKTVISYAGMDITWWYGGEKITWDEFYRLACSGSLDEPAA